VGAGTQAFAATTTKEFISTPFPLGVVHIFLGGLPFAETILGLFITVGLLSRWGINAERLIDHRPPVRHRSAQRLDNNRYSEDLLNYILSVAYKSV
jgi:hypothetical protein